MTNQSKITPHPDTFWHFLPANKRLGYGDNRVVQVGKWYRCEGDVDMRSNGMHACTTPLHALGFRKGPVICEVQLSEDATGDDKYVAKYRRVLRMANIENELFEFACKCASRALRSAGVTDKRCWNAIRVRRKWLRGQATDDQLRDAADAADAAYAAYAAYAAAADAADGADAAYAAVATHAAYAAAATHAAAAATHAAADAAAAYKAERNWQNKTLMRIINKAFMESES